MVAMVLVILIEIGNSDGDDSNVMVSGVVDGDADVDSESDGGGNNDSRI